jgi:glycine/D-amino acid oxidase-like deaminating enzyme
MLPFQQLSFWEKDTYIHAIDCIVLGSGIVGLSTAIELKKKTPKAKIIVLERGYLPTGASTKNAGFACFGGAAEILSDIQKTNESTVRKTIQYRWQGLQMLRKRLGDEKIQYDSCGSFDLYRKHEENEYETVCNQINYLNEFVADAISSKEKIYHLTNHKFGFNGTPKQIKNNFDGKINTGLMMRHLIECAIQMGIIILNGIEVKNIDFSSTKHTVYCNYGKLSAKQLFFCTNGLSKRFFPNLDIEPARAQVIVTSPIDTLKWNGTFHLEQGYYYFRNIDQRILLGGARNKDFETENTEQIENTSFILNELKSLLYNFILPNEKPSIEYEWAGIMGMGAEKFPLIKAIQKNVFCGIRLGGMGVAMGSAIGKELADLAIKQ